MPPHDPFSARATLSTPEGDRSYYRLDALASLGDIDRLPLSIKVLLESCLRNCDGRVVTEAHVRALAGYDAANVGSIRPTSKGRISVRLANPIREAASNDVAVDDDQGIELLISDRHDAGAG